MNLIKLENITKSYNGKLIFNNLNLEIEKGEFLGITGKEWNWKIHITEYNRITRRM